MEALHFLTIMSNLRIAIAADHGGVDLKNAIASDLSGKGYTVEDFGTDSSDSVNYADYATEVSLAILNGAADYGILVCTSGVGMSIAANRRQGVRAANVRSVEEAEITRLHNDANVLCLGQKYLTTEEGVAMAEKFLTTDYEGGRHEARVCGASGSRLAVTDPEIFAAVEAEGKRQRSHIELIASENFTSESVMEVQGSLLTNKYAEGYPGRNGTADVKTSTLLSK